MTFTRTDEQRELGQVVRSFLEAKAPSAEVRRIAGDGGHEPLIWKQLAQDLGILGLSVPEELGGAGMGFTETCVVMEELGRSLLPSPYLASAVLATQALLAAGRTELVPALVDGTRIGTLATTGELTAVPAGDAWSVTGTATYVLSGQHADLVLVLVDGRLLLLTGAPRVEVVDALDTTRPLAHLHLDATPAELVSDSGLLVVAHAQRLGAVALSAEQVGTATRALETAVDYARTRTQFERLIGSFQAVKHKCVDMLVATEQARSASLYAQHCADHDPDDLPIAASVAQAYCSDAAYSTAAACVQVHGGIGFTWEHDAHLLYKRAASARLLLGSPSTHRARLAELVNA